MMTKLKWYARGGNVLVSGPFTTQADATAAMLRVDGTFPDNIFIWSETPLHTKHRENIRRQWEKDEPKRRRAEEMRIVYAAMANRNTR